MNANKTETMAINGHRIFITNYENFSLYRIGSNDNTAPTVKHFPKLEAWGGTLYGEEQVDIVKKVFPNLTIKQSNVDDNQYEIRA